MRTSEKTEWFSSFLHVHTFIIHQFFSYSVSKSDTALTWGYARTAFKHSKNGGTTGSKTWRRINFLAETPSEHTSPVYIKKIFMTSCDIKKLCFLMHIKYMSACVCIHISKYLSNPIIKKDYSLLNYHHNDCMTEQSVEVTDSAGLMRHACRPFLPKPRKYTTILNAFKHFPHCSLWQLQVWVFFFWKVFLPCAFYCAYNSHQFFNFLHGVYSFSSWVCT